MNYYIYGANAYGEKAKRIIESIYGKTVKGFLDSYKTGLFKGLRITSIEDVDEGDNIIIAVQKPGSAVEIDKLLRNRMGMHIFWYGNLDGKLEQINSFEEDECLNTLYWQDGVLPHLEVHVSDKCNLNCKGCTHFSPLFHEVGDDYEQQIGALHTIKQLGLNIGRLDILGGEPFLNRDIKRYIEGIRELFPHSYIDVFSNGLLIPTLPPELFTVMRENGVSVSITEYQPTHRMHKQIVEKLEINKMRYRIIEVDKRQHFNLPLALKKNSTYPKLCISDGCYTIRNRSIARCPTLMYVDRINEVFDVQLPTEGIYPLESIHDKNELLMLMKKRVPLCDHCIEKDIVWDTCNGKPKLEDFVVLD